MSIHIFPNATWKNRFGKGYFFKIQKISSYTSSNNTVDNFECLSIRAEGSANPFSYLLYICLEILR